MSFFALGSGPFCILGNLYLLILIARAIVSWFPLRSDSPFIPIARVLNTVTEPVLAPFRRLIPPAGRFDISFIVVFFLLELIVVPLLCRIG